MSKQNDYFFHVFIIFPCRLDYVDNGPDLLPRKDVLLITYQIASAVHHCHENNVAHFDIKLENIMVEVTQHDQLLCKLCDFGCAKHMTEHDKLVLLDGQHIGTPLLYAPEQEHRQMFDRTVDYWLIGFVMLDLLTGCYEVNSPLKKTFYKHLKSLDQEKRVSALAEMKKVISDDRLYNIVASLLEYIGAARMRPLTLMHLLKP